jgi:hypothetical protein
MERTHPEIFTNLLDPVDFKCAGRVFLPGFFINMGGILYRF